MVTRYVVELDDGGELMVVRQNLETTSGEALEARAGECASRGAQSTRYAIEHGEEEEQQ